MACSMLAPGTFNIGCYLVAAVELATNTPDMMYVGAWLPRLAMSATKLLLLQLGPKPPGIDDS